ncbi:APT3 [Arabidopsis thaliana]|uniref:adenine phosphoribosyltransferase n=1 Tax=Arabidopsis thaliana TaxID=3702 RepID=A0A178UZN1_ARATH|nr:APT3 [Arabidopsis thaliana]
MSGNKEEEDPRIHGIKTKIRVVPDFPKKGIMFQDITTVLLDPKAFKDTIDLFVERYRDKNISVVAGKYYLSLQFIMLINFLYIVLFRWDY